jgi:hypothetical protein
VSDSFVIASRLAMSPAAFRQWMSAPVGRADAIANPAHMYDGWYWQGQTAGPSEWSDSETGDTPADVVASRIEVGAPSLSVARHRDGAAEIYLFDLGYEATWARQYLLMLAGAAPYLEPGPEQPCLLWAEPSGRLWAPGTLALLMVGPAGARFAGRHDLEPVTARLAPVEAVFGEMIDRMAGGEDPAAVQRDARYVDAAILSKVDQQT